MHKYDRIFKSTAYLMILTIFVKLIGFVKQAVIAYYFGTSEQMDIYLIAADFISEIGTVFFSTLSINLLTVYVKEIETGTKRDADRLVSNVFVCFAAIALGLSTLVWLSDDLLVKLLAPGFSANEQTLLSSYLRYLSIVILNICISNICIAILNGQKKFIHGKLIGFIQSICMILSCVFFGREEGNKAVIIGFISYYILQNIYLVWNTTKYVSFKPYKLFQDDNVKKLVKLCVPLFISNAVVQVNVMADKAIASYLQDGSVSAISYGHYIFSTIHVVIVGSLCTVVLSYFSAFIAKNEFSELVKVIQKGVYILLFILVPVVIVCIINSELIIRIIYGRGSFGEYSISITSRVFCGYAIGIIFVAIRDYFIQVLYALQANKVAMINGIIGVIVNITMSIILSRSIGIFGIALGDSIAYFILMFLSYFALRKSNTQISKMFGLSSILQIMFASGVSFLVGAFVNGACENINIYFSGIVSAVVSVVCFYSFLNIIRCRELLDLQNTLISRIVLWYNKKRK